MWVCIVTVVVGVSECAGVAGFCCIVTVWVCDYVERAGFACDTTSVSLRSSMCAGFRRSMDTVSSVPLRLTMKYLSVRLRWRAHINYAYYSYVTQF